MMLIFEEQLPYNIMALVVLALFYGVYLAKQFLLKKSGIRCMQMGTRKTKEVNTVETLMGIATVGIIVAQLLSIVMGWNHVPANARFTGFLVGLLGDVIFISSVICMKDSWRVGIPESGKTTLVTRGVYSVSRNPAFLGFYLQYIGVTLMFGNLLTAGFLFFAMTMLHMQILQEEKYLKETFGEEYEEYLKKVPGRYLAFTIKKR